MGLEIREQQLARGPELALAIANNCYYHVRVVGEKPRIPAFGHTSGSDTEEKRS